MTDGIPKLDVHFLPQFVNEAELAGGCVVMIDLLRASTSICHAMAGGAADIYPMRDVGDVVRAAEERVHAGSYLLAGERNCQRVEGFDLGNSPAEFTRDVVLGKQILFTTTNGTAALEHARLASKVYIGCAANLSALVDTLVGEDHIHLLCAGTGGHVTREDQLLAGGIVYGLGNSELSPRQRNGAADNVLREWNEMLTTASALGRTGSQQLAEELRSSLGGKNLVKVGMDSDIELCARIDTLSVVPVYDPLSKRIEL